MEQESHLPNKPFNPPFTHKKRSSKCLVYILLLVVFLSISFLILWPLVLKIKTPTLRSSNVVIKHLNYNSSSLNATIFMQIDLHNMNSGPFEFFNGHATLLYENTTIGATRMYHHGIIPSRKKRGLNVMIKIIGSDRVLKSENYVNFRKDIGSGLVKVRSLAEVRGEVRVVKIIRRRIRAFMNCSMGLNLKSQRIQDLLCQY